MKIPQPDGFLEPETQAPLIDLAKRDRSRSEKLRKIEGLGFTASKHIRMYGEQFEIVSGPFSEGDCVVVHAISGNDPRERILRLPTAILINTTIDKERI